MRSRPGLAERAGFEPAEPEGSRALQARAFGRTMQPLRAYYDQNYTIRYPASQESSPEAFAADNEMRDSISTSHPLRTALACPE
jgi:hypothetical protein